eukprot:COSAG02_NODE_60450_length_271_cov_0.709302_1_plen_22_part_10
MAARRHWRISVTNLGAANMAAL